MRIYIACGLTHIPREVFREYTAFIHDLAKRLIDAGHVVKYALINSDPQLADKPFAERARLCYVWDKEMVEEAEAVVAEASFPSIGLGIELQIAAATNTPIVLCFRDYHHGNKATPVTYTNPDHTQHHLQIGQGYVSLMALGIPSIFQIVQYANAKEGVQGVGEAVRLLQKD